LCYYAGLILLFALQQKFSARRHNGRIPQ